MATIKITKNSADPIMARKSNSTWIVEKGATVTVENNEMAIDAGSTHSNRTIEINGRLQGTGEMTGGIMVGTQMAYAEGVSVTVAKTGSIQAGSAMVIAAHDAEVTNHGKILGDNGVVVFGEDARIVNAGTIQASNGAVTFGLGDNTFVNTGTASGGSFGFAGFLIPGTSSKVVNHGNITGGDSGFMLMGEGGARLVVENHGSITGGSYAYTFANDSLVVDVIRNRGEMAGDISLGKGNDTFDGRDGITGGYVAGGEHNDTYFIDAPGLDMRENANEGIDTIKSEISWTLAQNFENLTLLGTNGLSATGNDVTNILTGNKGDNLLNGMGGADILDGGIGRDRLTGGQGADIFVFARGSDRDRILDFADGTDVIELEGFKTVKDFDDLKPLMEEKAGDVIIRFGEGDILRIENIDANQLSASDFLF